MDGRLLPHARLEWHTDDNGIETPRSVDFDDIYFSGSGLEETRHVFLDGNDLTTRFKTGPSPVIAELGFGTGLNFLATWQHWRQSIRPAGAALSYFAIEAFPLSHPDARRATSAWPDLADLAGDLIASWPVAVSGPHRIEFDCYTDHPVTLTVFHGDIIDGLSHLADTGISVDTWFLDGFSPSRNQAMWQAAIFPLIARASKVGTRAATFSAAGSIRRGLSASGFEVRKTRGFGRKRDMTIARFDPLPGDQPDPESHRNIGFVCRERRFQEPERSVYAIGEQRKRGKRRLQTVKTPSSVRLSDTIHKNDAPPWFSMASLTPLAMGARIAVVGAGIAGAGTAYAARMAGLVPVIFEAETPGAGASGNPAGLIMPRLDHDNTPAARFHLHAYLFTTGLLQRFGSELDAPLFAQLGAARLGKNAEEAARLRAMADAGLIPADWIEPCQDGLVFPQGGVVSPPDFVRSLIGATEVRRAHAIRIIHCPGGQQGELLLGDHEGRQHGPFDAVVLANGLEALGFLAARTLPLAGSIGQIDLFAAGRAPEKALAYGPYAAPMPDGKGLVLGATYRPLPPDAGLFYKPAPSLEASGENLSAMTAYRPDLTEGLGPGQGTPRAGIRCVTPDRVPIAGPLPDWGFFSGAYDGLRFGRRGPYPVAQYQPGVFALTGLGSRGLVTALLAAAMLMARMTGTPLPVTKDIETALHPARFFIRDLKRAKPQRPA